MLEKQHAEAEQQKTIKPVRERFSRIANATIRSKAATLRATVGEETFASPTSPVASTLAAELDIEIALSQPPSPAPVPKKSKNSAPQVKDWEYARSKLKMGEQ
jgi:hypothetical protein